MTSGAVGKGFMWSGQSFSVERDDHARSITVELGTLRATIHLSSDVPTFDVYRWNGSLLKTCDSARDAVQTACNHLAAEARARVEVSTARQEAWADLLRCVGED